MKTTTLLIGALLIGGGFYLYEQQAAAKTAPSLESKANLALASESNPYTLEALANQCDDAGLHTLAGLLHQKAQAILAFQKPQTQSAAVPQVHPAAAIAMLGAGSSTESNLTLHQALLSSGGNVAWLGQGSPPPPPDPNASPQQL